MSSRERFAALTPDINWLKLWDDARDHGLPGTRALEASLRILMTRTIPVTSVATSHIQANLQWITLPKSTSADRLQKSLTDPSEETFTLAASLRATFHRHHENSTDPVVPYLFIDIFLHIILFAIIIYRAGHAVMNFLNFFELMG